MGAEREKPRITLVVREPRVYTRRAIFIAGAATCSRWRAGRGCARGSRAWVEDADDVGILRLDDEALAFHGDRVTLAVPYAAVRSLRARNIGWRSLWLGGKRIEIVAGDGERELTFELLEREAHTLPTARHLSETVLTILSEKVRRAGESALVRAHGSPGRGCVVLVRALTL